MTSPIVPGDSSPENQVMAPIIRHFQIDKNNPSGTYTLCPVPAGYIVTEVATVVTEVCDGTPTLKIGDDDDDDGYLVSTDIAPGTAQTATTPAVKRATAIANPYRYGKYYATAGAVKGVWVKGTNPTTGIIRGYVVMTNPAKDGVPPGATTVTPL
jgi:hypothetical protein